MSARDQQSVDSEEPSLYRIRQALTVQRAEAQEYNQQAKDDIWEIKQAFTDVTLKVTQLSSEVTDLQQRVAAVEEANTYAANFAKMQDSQIMFMQAKIEDLENRQRRQTLRVFSIPEGREGSDSRAFIVRLFQKALPDLADWGDNHSNITHPFYPNDKPLDADRPPAAESLDVFAAESLDVFEIICKENVESKQLLQGGDIAVKLGRSAMICKDDSCFWPKSSDGTVNVPYTLRGYSDSEVASITDAISEFAGLTCIRFVDHTSETDYLQIAPGDGCWSFMGRTGGPQPLSLIGGCLSRGSIQHELNHALGFHHEQSRSDRDEYVRIMTENISDGNLANFNKENTNNLGLEYDYSSIMHYGRYAFTKTTGQATIVPIKNPNAEIGQRVGLSNLDLAKINRLYDCNMHSTISRVGFGFLNSINYPSQYPNNTEFSYLIQANVAKILLTFTAFDIESSPKCKSDYVKVYDGMTKDSPVLLNKACGRGSVPPVVSSRNVMLLQFVTNGAISASGFNTYYQNVACAQSYSTSPGTVTSENYPQNYPASLDCGYYISAPSGKKISLTFTDFDLEPSMPTCRADKLVIFNGRTIKDPLIGRYCGSGPVLSVVSSGNSLLLQFHSDSSDQMKGFQATYTFECFPENLELQQKQAKLTTNYHRSYSGTSHEFDLVIGESLRRDAAHIDSEKIESARFSISREEAPTSFCYIV
ncbi:embryonic protein UVS.2-like [Lissotriton helveticus]